MFSFDEILEQALAYHSPSGGRAICEAEGRPEQSPSRAATEEEEEEYTKPEDVQKEGKKWRIDWREEVDKRVRCDDKYVPYPEQHDRYTLVTDEQVRPDHDESTRAIAMLHFLKEEGIEIDDGDLKFSALMNFKVSEEQQAEIKVAFDKAPYVGFVSVMNNFMLYTVFDEKRDMLEVGDRHEPSDAIHQMWQRAKSLEDDELKKPNQARQTKLYNSFPKILGELSSCQYFKKLDNY